MTETKIDRPINGDISHYTTRSRVPQKSAAEFIAAIDTILSVEGVEAVRWEQYTPYFNDGDPCEFTTHDFSVKFEGNDDEGDYEDGYLDSWSLTFEREPGVFPYLPEGVTLEQAKAVAGSNLNFNAYLDVLQDNFGDPAQVTATSEGFDVEYYEHD